MKRKHALLACCFGFWLAVASGAKVSSQSLPQRIEVTAKRFAFTPGEITLKKGQPAILVLKSEDVAHGIRILELNVELKTKARGTAQIEFTPDKTGDFIGHCWVFCGSGHGSMMIKVHVVA